MSRPFWAAFLFMDKKNTPNQTYFKIGSFWMLFSEFTDRPNDYSNDKDYEENSNAHSGLENVAN